MEFRVLGPLEVCAGDRRIPLGGFRQRLVLGAMLLYPNRPLTTDWLVDAVWGEAPPRTARKTLQAYVSRLRSLLGSELIEATDTGYQIRLSLRDLDSARFEQLAEEGRLLVATDSLAAARLLRRALALWRGLPWGDLGDEVAIQSEAQRLRELRLQVVEDRIAADLECGRAASVVAELEGLVQEHPLREGLRSQLMLALYRSGRQSDALRAYESTRRYLGEELGIEPSPQLRDLEEMILLQDPAIAGPAAASEQDDWTMARNPYKGLRPFRRQDSADFFGRSDLVERLVASVEQERLVAVVGASGSGKSSLVRAGLVPRLPSASWLVATMVPGRHPFVSLQSALRAVAPRGSPVHPGERGDDLDLVRSVEAIVPDNGPQLLLVIDQFEELFHQVDDEAVRSCFLRNVVEAVDDPSAKLTVLATLRADYFDRALEHSPLGERVAAHMVSVLPLRAHELEAAAARPAEQVGIHMEPELVAELVGEMTLQPGTLPLFQYVLTELFAARTGPMLTRAAYRDLGGLSGALSRRAEDTYQALDPEVRPLARQVFVRLVTVGDGLELSRRRMERTALEALDPAIKSVLDSFDEARLLTFDRSPEVGVATVEVAHEALLREWPRLSGWIDEGREDLRLHGVLMAAATDWETSERDPDYLLSGSRLALYDGWESVAGIELTASEEEFLATSVQRRVAQEQYEVDRHEEELRLERRSVRRLRWLVAVVSIAAIVAAGLTLFAVNRNREAAASEREARARELANAALVNAEADPELGILLALAAIETTRAGDGLVVREAEEALHVAVNAHRVVGTFLGTGDVRYQLDDAFRPDGALFALGETVRLVDPASGNYLLEIPGDDSGVPYEAVAMSPDGALVATCSGRGRVFLWDAQDGTNVGDLGHMGNGPLAFSADGRFLAGLAPGRGRVVVWDVADQTVVSDRIDHGGYVPYPPKLSVAINPDGSLAAVTMGTDIRILDVDSGEWVQQLTGHTSLTTSVAFADETTVVSGAMDGTFRVWNGAVGVEQASIDAGVGQMISLAVSPDGHWVLTGGDGGAVRLWELQLGGASLVSSLQGIRSMVTDLAFNSSGTLGAGVGLGGQVVRWDVTAAGRGEVASWPAVGPVAFSREGDQLAVGDATGRGVDVLGTADWSPVQHLADVVPYVGDHLSGYGDEWGMLGGLEFSPGADVLATATHGWEVVLGAVRLWDVSTGDLATELGTSMQFRGPVRFSGDGARVASANCAMPVTSVWDVASGELLFNVPQTGCGHIVGLDRYGELVAVQGHLTDNEPFVQVWDVDSGQLVMEASHRSNWLGAAEFSPAGDRLLTAGAEGSLRVWDIATGGLVMLLEGHTGSVEAAGWSADGSLIFSAGLDGTARLWDATTGAMMFQLSGLEGFPYVAMSPDGRWLATSAGGTAKVWALDLDELIDIAQGRLTRTFRDAECVTYHFEECPP